VGGKDMNKRKVREREEYYTPSTPTTRTSSSNIIHVSHAFGSTEEATQKSTSHGSVAVLSKSRSPAQTYKTFLTNFRKGSRGAEDLSRFYNQSSLRVKGLIDWLDWLDVLALILRRECKRMFSELSNLLKP
jgi:hypothetical protein